MIKVLDYGLGNIKAFINAYNRIDVSVKVISSLKEIKDSDKLILPGVGHFDDAMFKLKKKFNLNILNNIVVQNKTPIIGICVGMQILGISSEEGKEKGLGWINSNVKRLISDKHLMLPHMGWNTLNFTKKDSILNGIHPKKNKLYFLHSFYLDCHKDIIIASTSYNINFPTVIKQNNIYGIQCHPEKSHGDGINILKNFSRL